MKDGNYESVIFNFPPMFYFFFTSFLVLSDAQGY